MTHMQCYQEECLPNFLEIHSEGWHLKSSTMMMMMMMIASLDWHGQDTIILIKTPQLNRQGCSLITPGLCMDIIGYGYFIVRVAFRLDILISIYIYIYTCSFNMTQWTSELVILTVWKRVRDTYNPSNDRPICTDDIFIIDICVYIYILIIYIYLFIHYILYIFQDRHPLWLWMALFQMPIFQGSSWRSWVRGSSRCELLGFAFAGVRICCWEVSLFWCLNHKDTQYIYTYIYMYMARQDI